MERFSASLRFTEILRILMFAFGMAIGRFTHGLLGNRVSLSKSMLIGSMGVFLCMLTMGLSPYPVLSFIACALSGICVALLWPGTLVLASESFPKSGAWLFAFMAVSGDLGAAACPFVTGKLADMAGEISFLADIANRFSLSSEQTVWNGLCSHPSTDLLRRSTHNVQSQNQEKDIKKPAPVRAVLFSVYP